MLPRLEAEERLAAIGDGQLAFGVAERGNALRQLAALRRTARGGERLPVAKASPAVLAGMGIGVVKVPSAPAEKGLSDG